jgi:hypothetical protein
MLQDDNDIYGNYDENPNESSSSEDLNENLSEVSNTNLSDNSGENLSETSNANSDENLKAMMIKIMIQLKPSAITLKFKVML